MTGITSFEKKLLQSVTSIIKCDKKLLQSVTGITKCDSYCKVRRNGLLGRSVNNVQVTKATK